MIALAMLAVLSSPPKCSITHRKTRNVNTFIGNLRMRLTLATPIIVVAIAVLRTLLQAIRPKLI